MRHLILFEKIRYKCKKNSHLSHWKWRVPFYDRKDEVWGLLTLTPWEILTPQLEADNRAAFVGECKIWRGAKSLHDAIDQLLGYLTWRDCRCSLVIFNKNNKGFSSIVKKIPNILNDHPQCQSCKSFDEGEWQAIFNLEIDEEREVYVHVFIFDLYID